MDYVLGWMLRGRVAPDPQPIRNIARGKDIMETATLTIHLKDDDKITVESEDCQNSYDATLPGAFSFLDAENVRHFIPWAMISEVRVNPILTEI